MVGIAATDLLILFLRALLKSLSVKAEATFDLFLVSLIASLCLGFHRNGHFFKFLASINLILVYGIVEFLLCLLRVLSVVRSLLAEGLLLARLLLVAESIFDLFGLLNHSLPCILDEPVGLLRHLPDSNGVLLRVCLEDVLVEPGGTHGLRVIHPDDEGHLPEDVERNPGSDQVHAALALENDAVDDPVCQPLPVVFLIGRLHRDEAHENRISQTEEGEDVVLAEAQRKRDEQRPKPVQRNILLAEAGEALDSVKNCVQRGNHYNFI